MKEVTTEFLSQVIRQYKNNNLFIDVRTQEEWDASRIEEFTLIPINLDNFTQKLEEKIQTKLQNNSSIKSLDVYFLCRSGVRSLNACSLGSSLFSVVNNVNINYYNIKGGILQWNANNS